MKNQAFGDNAASQYMMSKKIMEINPRHPIVSELLRLTEENEEDEEAKDLAVLLLDTSLFQSGFNMENTNDFSQRMYRLMKRGLNLDSLELLDEIDITEQEEDEEEDEVDEDAQS